MRGSSSPAPLGQIASLHLHGWEPGGPLTSADQVELVEHKGIFGEPRYFGRLSRRTGQPSRRQVSLIERELTAQHAAALGITLPPGTVRANIETTGVELARWVGQKLRMGDAVLFLYELRTPCAKMDAICPGLRALMESGRQGVLAEVVRSGKIRVGDLIFASPL